AVRPRRASAGVIGQSVSSLGTFSAGCLMAVRLEKQDSIGHIVLDRPPANSYDRAFMEELDAAIDEARRDDGVKAILVRSALERFFSAGADVSVFAKSDMYAQNAFVVCANEAIAKLESAPKV